MKPADIFLFGAAGLAAAVLVMRQQDGAGYAQQAQDVAAGMGNNFLEVIGMRGISNNNPGNIRHSGAAWQGMRPQQTDAAFVQFTSAEYGVRALSKILDTYQAKYGLNTVAGIIGRYAPSVENNTASYINAVASAMGILPGAAFDVRARKSDLIAAIIKHENGIQPYSLATINNGVLMA